MHADYSGVFSAAFGVSLGYYSQGHGWAPQSAAPRAANEALAVVEQLKRIPEVVAVLTPPAPIVPVRAPVQDAYAPAPAAVAGATAAAGTAATSPAPAQGTQAALQAALGHRMQGGAPSAAPADEPPVQVIANDDALRTFLTQELRPEEWVHTENIDAARRFIERLHKVFGVQSPQ